MSLHRDMLDALEAAERIVRKCHGRDIPIPEFQTQTYEGRVTLEVSWYRTSMAKEHEAVEPSLIEEVFDVEFHVPNSLGNMEAETELSDTRVEFIIYS